MNKYQIYPKRTDQSYGRAMRNSGTSIVALLERLNIRITHPLELTDEEVLLIRLALDPNVELRKMIPVAGGGYTCERKTTR